MENNEIEQNQAIEEEVKFESTDFGSAASNEPEKKKKKNIFGILFGGDILDNKLLSKNYGLLLLICFFSILLVGNRYWVEQLSRDKGDLEKEIQYLKQHNMDIQQKYQESVKITQISDQLDTLGIRLISGPPYEVQRIDLDEEKARAKQEQKEKRRQEKRNKK